MEACKCFGLITDGQAKPSNAKPPSRTPSGALDQKLKPAMLCTAQCCAEHSVHCMRRDALLGAVNDSAQLFRAGRTDGGQ
jgi:hypothetical protein